MTAARPDRFELNGQGPPADGAQPRHGACANERRVVTLVEFVRWHRGALAKCAWLGPGQRGERWKGSGREKKSGSTYVQMREMAREGGPSCSLPASPLEQVAVREKWAPGNSS